MAYTESLSLQHKQVYEIVAEYIEIFSSLIGVLKDFQVKHTIDLTLGAPMPNGLVYSHSLIENDEIKYKL
jgi:hypothetical protein